VPSLHSDEDALTGSKKDEGTMSRRAFLAAQLAAGSALALASSHLFLEHWLDAPAAAVRGLHFECERARPFEHVWLSLDTEAEASGTALVALIGNDASVLKEYEVSLDSRRHLLQLPAHSSERRSAADTLGSSTPIRALLHSRHGLLVSAPLELVVVPFVFGL